MTDTLNEPLQHYYAKAKTYCAKSKALSYYLDFMFSYKLELGRVTLGSEITWENWHSRCAQVHPTIMSMWTCFQKTNISIHTFFFLFQKWKLCQMPKLKKDSTLVQLDVFLAMFCGLECNIASRQKLNQRKWMSILSENFTSSICKPELHGLPKPNFLPHSLGMLELDVR